jgi:hypothetical protein
MLHGYMGFTRFAAERTEHRPVVLINTPLQRGGRTHLDPVTVLTVSREIHGSKRSSQITM